MGMDDLLPDNDVLVQAAFALDVVNTFLRSHILRTVGETNSWQAYCFDFGVSFCRLFNTNVTTKLNSLRSHVDHHLILLGCLRRTSSEENEMDHKQIKSVYGCTNKRLWSLGPQLMTASNDPSLSSFIMSHDTYDAIMSMNPVSTEPCTPSLA